MYLKPRAGYPFNFNVYFFLMMTIIKGLFIVEKLLHDIFL